MFEIQGPDENGDAWICSPEGRDVWCRNLGPYEAASEVMCQWLGANDYGEHDEGSSLVPVMRKVIGAKDAEASDS